MIFCPAWPWKLMDNLEKQKGTSSILRQDFCIISNPSVKSNLSYSLEMLNSGSKLAISLSHVTLKFDGWPWKIIGHLFHTTLSFVQHFKAIGIFKLELHSGNAQFGSKLAIFCPAWPWKLMDVLEQGKSEGFVSCNRPCNLTQIGFKSSIFQPVWPWNLMDELEKL